MFLFLILSFFKLKMFSYFLNSLYFSIFPRLLLCCFFSCLSLGRSLLHTLAPLQSLGLSCKSYLILSVKSISIHWKASMCYLFSISLLIWLWSTNFKQLCPIILSWCWSCACPSSTRDICIKNQSKSNFFVIRHTLGKWLHCGI